MRNDTPLYLDCKLRDASQGSELNVGFSSGSISASNSDGILADDSKVISNGITVRCNDASGSSF